MHSHSTPPAAAPHGQHRHHSPHVPRPSAAPPDPPPADTVYTCPMHPQVRQSGPGHCPKCGMALEPVLPSLDAADDNPALRDFSRRFWWTLPLTMVVTTLAMAGHRLGWVGMATQSGVELVLTLPIVLWAGAPFFVRDWQSVVQRSPNMWPAGARQRCCAWPPAWTRAASIR